MDEVEELYKYEELLYKYIDVVEHSGLKDAKEFNYLKENLGNYIEELRSNIGKKYMMAYLVNNRERLKFEVMMVELGNIDDARLEYMKELK